MRFLISIGFALSSLIFVSCSTPAEKSNSSIAPASTSKSDARSETAPAEPPKCLSIQEGDRHVEFNGTDLFLAEEGPPVRLKLNDGEPVICEKLEIVRKAKQASVYIKYQTYEAGTSIGISDTKIAIASIKNAKWILSPVVVERRFRRSENLEVDERFTYAWSNEDTHPKLTITNKSDNSVKVIKP